MNCQLHPIKYVSLCVGFGSVDACARAHPNQIKRRQNQILTKYNKTNDHHHQQYIAFYKAFKV